MLLTKEIEITLTPIYIKHFTELGYTLSKRPDRDGNMTVPKGTKIRIKVDDLMPKSMYDVEVKCDYCNRIIKKKFRKYIIARNVIAKDCCNECDKIKGLEVLKLKYGENYRSPLDIPGVPEKIRKKTRRHNIVEIGEEFKERKLVLISCEFISVDHYLDFTCIKHAEVGIQKVKYANFRNKKGGCRACRYEKMSGRNAYQWKNGITALQNYVRDKMKKWKYESFDNCNRRCSITHYKKTLVIHHMHKNFNEILEETLRYVGLPSHKNIGIYTPNQLKIIVDTCLELHFKYGYGITLRKEIHELYHHNYKRQNNNDIQFYEFRDRYLNGEFDKELPEKLSSKNSLERLKCKML